MKHGRSILMCVLCFLGLAIKVRAQKADIEKEMEEIKEAKVRGL
jgi:hypothetical protein